jgi:hypothetical protein
VKTCALFGAIVSALLAPVACGDGKANPQPDAANAGGVCVRKLTNPSTGNPYQRCEVLNNNDLCKSGEATYYESSSCSQYGFTVVCKRADGDIWWKAEYVAEFPLKEDQVCGSAPALGPCRRAGEVCSVNHCYGPSLTIPSDAKPCVSTANCPYGFACMESYQDKTKSYCLILCASAVPSGGSTSTACQQCKKTCSGQGSWCQCDQECG